VKHAALRRARAVRLGILLETSRRNITPTTLFRKDTLRFEIVQCELKFELLGPRV